MIKKSIVAIVVIVAAAAVVFAASGNHTNSTSTSQEQSLSANDSDSSTSNNTTNEVKISSEEAQNIAQKYIEEPGASAGTPTLGKMDGKFVYTVPVIENSTNVGEIYVDANTGENLGGAGGAP